MAKGTLHVVARITARPDKTEALRSVLSALIEPTHAEAGCIRYSLLQNKEDKSEFTFIEEWRDEDTLAAHLATPHFMEAAEKMAELTKEEPDIRKYLLVG